MTRHHDRIARFGHHCRAAAPAQGRCETSQRAKPASVLTPPRAWTISITTARVSRCAHAQRRTHDPSTNAATTNTTTPAIVSRNRNRASSVPGSISDPRVAEDDEDDDGWAMCKRLPRKQPFHRPPPDSTSERMSPRACQRGSKLRSRAQSCAKTSRPGFDEYAGDYSSAPASIHARIKSMSDCGNASFGGGGMRLPLPF